MTPETRTRLVHLIRGAQFTPVRVREGYDMGQVDDLLARVVAALQADQPVADLVRDALFKPVRLREGYDMGDVDALLEQVLSAADPDGAAEESAQLLAMPEHARELVDELEHTRFTPVRLRDGYDMGEVDAFLDRVVTALRAGEPLGPVLLGVEFTSTGLRGGYASAEVDDLVTRLRRY